MKTFIKKICSVPFIFRASWHQNILIHSENGKTASISGTLNIPVLEIVDDLQI